MARPFSKSSKKSGRKERQRTRRPRTQGQDIVERSRIWQALLESEDRYRATFDCAPVGIMHTNVDSDRILRANSKLSEMLGYAPGELLGMTADDIRHPDGRGTNRRRSHNRVLQGEIETYSSERMYRRKDGSPLWVNRTVSLVRDAGGKPQYFISMMEDINDRKQALEAAARERVLLRTIIDTVPEYIYVKDAQGRFLLANQSWLRARGKADDDIAGKTVFDFFTRDMAEKMAAQDADVVRTGVPMPEREQRIILNKTDGKQDESRWAAISKVPMRDPSGDIIGTVGVSRDITERKRGEEALRESEERFRATFNSAPVGIMHTGIADERILQANPKLSEMLGYTRDELLDMTLDDIIHPDYTNTDRLIYREKMLAGELASFSSERKYLRKDGSAIWVNRIVSLARDAAGKPIYFIRIVEDVTERKISAHHRAMEHAVTHALAESVTVEGAMQLVLRTICQALEWTCGVYWKWNEEDELLRCAETWHADAAGVAEFVAASEERPNEAPAWHGAAPGTSVGGIVRRVWFSGAPVWFPDVTRHPDFRRGTIAAKADLRSAFGFPILSGDQPLGVMEFYSREIRQPDVALLQIVRAIGSQIGQFIQRKEAEQALRTSEERYRDVFEASPLPMWVWDDETLDIVAVNQAATSLYGYSREEFLRMNVRDVWAPGEATHYERNISNRTQQQSLQLQRKHLTKDGSILDTEVTARLFTLGGRPVWLTVVNDVSVRVRAEAALRESEEQFRQLAGNIPQVFWITDTSHRQTLYVSPAAETMLGRPLQDILSDPRALVRAVHREDRARVYAARKTAVESGYDETYRIIRSDGSIRWVHDRAFPVRDGDGRIYRIAGIAEDVTDRKHAEERLEHLAHYDVMTNLPNRVLFYDRLKQALVQAKRNRWTTGIMFIDVDRFKNVNDTLGHAVGDNLLQQIAERLSRSIRSGDTVGRLGGDEFAIVLSTLASAQDVNIVAQKIMTSFNEPFKLEGTEVYVTASIGITLYPDDSSDQDVLIKNADAAMYRAKKLGRNSYQFYTPEMNASAIQFLGMESSLRRALERNEFLMYYQPKASVADGDITGLEALLRWRHPERGLVSPAEFIPLLEETGFIVQVGEWVLKAVCSQIKAWELAGERFVPVAVNLSARQFAANDLGPTIRRILEEHQVDPALIEFEITESSLMANTEEAARTLEYLDQLGVSLSVDDFGTGYSSLGYLKRFPLSALKIDRSFVRDITSDGDDATITRAVISMAHSLGLKVIAEGVETRAQLEFLAEYGCNEIQGYYFSRPMAAEDCSAWVKAQRRLELPRPASDVSVPIVLLLDDDEDALAHIQRILARDGYRIFAARSAREGLALLRDHRVDVVVSDQNMPGMSGVDFLQCVQSLSPKTMRILATRYADFQTMAAAVNKGGIFRCLSKDMTEEVLRASVREAVQAKALFARASSVPSGAQGN